MSHKSKTSQETLTKIVALLAHDAADRRSAAAIVLSELAPGDAATLEALRKAVRRTDDDDLRLHAAEALGAIAPKSIVKDLKPLLKDPVDEVRETAKRVLASGRGVTAEDVARMLEAKDDRQRVSAIAVLGAMGTPAARRSILTQLAEGNGRIYEAIRDAMVPILETSSGKDADAAAEEIANAMDRKALAGDDKLGTTVVALLAASPSEAATGPLLDVATMTAPTSVRVAAVEALRDVVQGRKPSQRVFGALLELVERPDTPRDLFGPLTGTLGVLDVPLALEPRVRKLLASDDTVVRRWALRGLGRLDSAPAAKALAEVVATGDATDRDIALEAALATTSGKTALAKRVGKLKDVERAQAIVAGLRPHLEGLQQAILHHLEEATLEASPEVAGVVMGLLKQTGGRAAGRAHDGLFDKAIRFKEEARYMEAADIFRRMSAGADDPEARFQLGVCELMMSRRKVARGGGRNDPCIDTLSRLQRARDFPIVERLSKEPVVGEEELYYLGFSLAEGDEADQGLGGDILMLIADSESDTKLHRMAKNKLVTMGWLE